MNATQVYSAMSEGQSYTAARSLVEFTADSTHSCEILRAWVGNEDVETSQHVGVRILRKTVAGTGTSVTPKAFYRSAADAFGGTARHNMTAEGTAGDVLVRDGFNILQGWTWLPTPKEQIIVPPSGILAVELMTAPASATVLSAGIIFAVYGNVT